MTTPAIEVVGLVKAFRAKRVLEGIDLAVAPGTVTALLGPNGAGKTTTVHILSTLLRPDAGTARIAGHDVVHEADAVRAAIGLTGQFSAVDMLMTGEENLRLMADLRHLGKRAGRARVTELLERFELTDAARKPLATYSGGMRRRLDLAMTLVARPRIVFLDEPTSGLDPRSRRTMWELVGELVRDGVTILLTTQNLDEADQLAHRVGVLDGGRIIAEGTPAQLKSRVPGGHVEVQFIDAARLTEVAAVLPEATADAESLTLRTANDGVASLRRLLDRLDDDAVAGLTVRSADLDDVFLAITGHAAETQDGAEDENDMEAVR